MSDLDCLAEQIRKLTPHEKEDLASLLADDRALVDAIVPRSHIKPMIDMLLEVLRTIARSRPSEILRKELAYRKRQADEKLGAVQSRLESYRRGPEARAKNRQAREALIRQYRNAGITDAKKILDALRRDAPELVKRCSLKT